MSGDLGTSESIARAGVRAANLEKVSMNKAFMAVRSLMKDEDGAALVEYTVLLGIMLVAVIATIVAVGTWVNGKWTALNTALAGH